LKFVFLRLGVEFLLKTDSGYPNLFVEFHHHYATHSSTVESPHEMSEFYISEERLTLGLWSRCELFHELR